MSSRQNRDPHFKFLTQTYQEVLDAMKSDYGLANQAMIEIVGTIDLPRDTRLYYIVSLRCFVLKHTRHPTNSFTFVVCGSSLSLSIRNYLNSVQMYEELDERGAFMLGEELHINIENRPVRVLNVMRYNGQFPECIDAVHNYEYEVQFNDRVFNNYTEFRTYLTAMQR